MVSFAKIPVSMYADEFLAWPGDGRSWQLINGEPKAMAPANPVHALLQGELGSVIGKHLRQENSPCRLYIAPGVVPPMLSSRNVRVPDLAVDETSLENDAGALTNPVLLVELLSPERQAKARANVWAYVSIPSVREIVMLQTASVGAELLRRGADGSWPRESERVTEGDLVLESIGFRTPLMELYRGTRLHRPPA